MMHEDGKRGHGMPVATVGARNADTSNELSKGTFLTSFDIVLIRA
jgi:hypothetical protein